MNDEQALMVIKNAIDMSISKGAFSTAADVLTVVDAYNHLAKKLTPVLVPDEKK